MSEKTLCRVGSRKSQLALIQTKEVIEHLKKLFPEKNFEIVEITTVGDKILDKPLPKIGEKSLFTKELEVALLAGDVDFVVHSLKDLPTVLPDGLTIGAILEREDPRDALLLSTEHETCLLKNLPKSSVIGTSSLRRTAQLHRKYPHLKVENIRGNLNTRLRKLDEDKIYAGIILAVAGVKRMKWEKRIREYLDPSDFLYAVGQGAIAVECRTDDDAMLETLELLNHIPTILRVICERSYLKTLGGGCSAPVAVHSTYTNNSLKVTGAVWSLDGSETIQKTTEAQLKYDDLEPPRKWSSTERHTHVGISVRNIEKNDLHEAENLGKKLAQEMISLGALKIIEGAKLVNEKTSIIHTDKLDSGDSVLENNLLGNGAKR